jgi:hypothetical protein
MGGFRSGDEGAVDATATLVARVNLISHATVRAAVTRLQDEYGIADADAAFQALYEVSQRYDVKLRHLSAAVLNTEPGSGKRMPEPALPFSPQVDTGVPKRSTVFADLLATAVGLTAADSGAVQLRHAVHGGLCIESHCGLSDGYRHHFSYIDDGVSAAGRATTHCELVRVDDVTISPLYTYADEALLTAEGIRAEFAAPMCDEDGHNWGAVTVHFHTRHPRIDPFAVEMLHGHADACAQWLEWYDQTVLPLLIDEVHDAAAARAAAAVTQAVSA